MKHEQVYFTKAEAAEYLRCSPRALDYARARDELKAYRPDRKKLLFTREDLDAFARKRAVSVDSNRIGDAVAAGGD